MAALLAAADIRTHVDTDLVDAALTRLIDDADAEIISFAGAIASQVEEVHGCALHESLTLSRRGSAVTTVVETVDDTATTLAADDYSLRADGLTLDRLATGTNARETWGDSVVVTYTPVDQTARRKRVLIDLVRLAVEHKALASESVGDYSATSVEYERERTRILSRLREGLPIA